MSRTVSFSVSGLDFPDGVDPLGVWQVETLHHSSFTTTATSTMNEVTWRILLPENLNEAETIVQSQQNNIEEQQRYLDIIDNQLEDYDPKGTQNLSFVTSQHSPLATLQHSISQIHSWSGSYSTAGSQTDYTRLYEQCETLLSRIKDNMSLHGRIETRIGQNLVGITQIDWIGDYKTVWEKHATLQTMHLHTKSVHLTSISRMVVLRIISTSISGALGIAIKAAIPGGQILLIPAVYKFVLDMLHEFKKLQESA